IFLMVLGLVSLQLLLLPLEIGLFELMVPISFRADMPLQQATESFWYLTMLFPHTFTEFVLYYGAGFMAVFVLFAVILFERSFRWKGLIAGILYGVFSIAIFFAPTIPETSQYLYPLELVIAQVVMG